MPSLSPLTSLGVYTAIWYNLKPLKRLCSRLFAIKKGGFKLSTPAKCTSHVKLSKGGQSTNIKSLKIQNVLRPWNQILAYKTMLWMSVVRTLVWCFHILGMSSIHTGEHTNNNVLNPSAERSQTARIALLFTERSLTTVVTLFFRWKLREVSFRHEWFLISASFKVRPRTDDRDVSQDSRCFFGL